MGMSTTTSNKLCYRNIISHKNKNKFDINKLNKILKEKYSLKITYINTSQIIKI